MSERRASMGDKVYRCDVVKFIRNNISLGTFMKRTVKTADEACWDLCDKLNYVPAIEEKDEPHWIPVTERLPEGIDQAIVQTNGGAIHEAFYKGKNDYGHEVWMRLDGDIYWDDEVVAWMPLPEPFKGVTDGND